MVRVVWGKIRSQEDYEDTERTSALDLGYSLMPVPRGNEGAGAMKRSPLDYGPALDQANERRVRARQSSSSD
jgi:hypothetical protein